MMRNIVAVLADFAAHVLPPLGKCAIALVFGLAIVPQGPSIRTDALRKRQKKTPALAGALFAARSDGYLADASGIAVFVSRGVRWISRYRVGYRRIAPEGYTSTADSRPHPRLFHSLCSRAL